VAYNRAGMATGQLTTEELARLLREAERAHGDYERQLGKRDEEWPTWYAEFILDQLRARGTGPGP
jgi:hypothetical protein